MKKTNLAAAIRKGSSAAVLMFASGAAIVCTAQTAAPVGTDKFAWLEDIHGDRQLAWVRAHDAATAAVIEKQPLFGELQAQALRVLESPDRLPSPDLLGG